MDNKGNQTEEILYQDLEIPEIVWEKANEAFSQIHMKEKIKQKHAVFRPYAMALKRCFDRVILKERPVSGRNFSDHCSGRGLQRAECGNRGGYKDNLSSPESIER